MEGAESRMEEGQQPALSQTKNGIVSSDINLKLRKKTKGATDCPLLPVWGLSPRYFADLQLLQNQVRSRSASHGACGGPDGDASGVRIKVQYAIFFRAEPANTGLVEDERR